VAGGSAYLKIADGCRRPCAFCAIPLDQRHGVSRPVSAIVDEAQRLHEMGVRELILIGPDTTDYGHDLGLKDGPGKPCSKKSPPPSPASTGCASCTPSPAM